MARPARVKAARIFFISIFAVTGKVEMESILLNPIVQIDDGDSEPD